MALAGGGGTSTKTVFANSVSETLLASAALGAIYNGVVADAPKLKPSTSPGQKYADLLLEGAPISSALGAIYNGNPNDSILLSGSASPIYNVLVSLSDRAVCGAYEINKYIAVSIFLEALKATAPTVMAVAVLFTDGFKLTVTETERLTARLAQLEGIKLSGLLHALGKYGATVTEAARFAALCAITYLLFVQETATLHEGLSYLPRLILKVAEKLVAAGLVSSLHHAIEAVADIAVMTDSAVRFWGMSLTDGIVCAPTAASQAAFLSALAETALLASPASTSATLTFFLEDHAALAENYGIRQVLSDVLGENLKLRIGFTLDGELYTGWVMNTLTYAVSEYQNYNFNSTAIYQGAYLGLSKTGLYRLTGGTDAGAHVLARARTATMDFGSGLRKRMKAAYVGITATDALVLKTVTDDDAERWYTLSPYPSGIHTERVLLARGVQSRYWAFELANNNGADFRLDNLELLPVLLERRI